MSGETQSAAKAITGEAAIERSTMRRITLRIVPLLLLAYFIAYLDRVNLSFAALQMNKDLGLSNAAYGLGAGLFFLTYCVFEVPSNLILQRVGPIKWLARIMISWGLVSASMAFVANEWMLYAMRLLLGAAEAGFFPGVLYLVSLWFPASHRGRVLGLFVAGAPASGIIGAPLSAYLLTLDGLGGLHGWQWLFLVEGLPAVLLAPAFLLLLQDDPAKAKWLTDAEKTWLAGRLHEDDRHSVIRKSPLAALVAPIVFACAAIYFAATSLLNGITFFLPQVVRNFGLSEMQVGLVVALPSVLGLIVIIWWGRMADISQAPRRYAAMAVGYGGGALVLSALSPWPLLSMAAISVAYATAISFAPPFWAFISSLFPTRSRAGGVAAISSLGVTGGFFAPTIMGYLKDLTGDFHVGLFAVGAGGLIAAAALLFAIRTAPHPEGKDA